MKNLKGTLIALSLLITLNLNSQTNHSTINDLSVSYKSAPASLGGTNLSDMKCTPQATITLKANANVSRIYFKITDPQSNTVVYQVNYALSASPVITNGVKLFEITGDVIYLSTGQLTTLRPYVYELKTEDSNDNQSTAYTSTK